MIAEMEECSKAERRRRTEDHARLCDAFEQLQERQQAIEALREKRDSLEAELASCKRIGDARIREMTSQMIRMSSKLETLEEQRASLEAKLTAAQSRIAELEANAQNRERKS